MRAFDHLVMCVDDLVRARSSYERLGFTLTPPATHPFGTRNSLMQFSGRTFLELLAIGDASATAPHELPGRFSFGAFNAGFLQRCGEGASMLVFAGSDARADVAAFRAAGLDTYEPLDFSRDAMQPDGTLARVGFSLAFVTHPEMPDAAIFTCQHRHAPQTFWKRDYQTHRNGARNFGGIVVCCSRPAMVQAHFKNLGAALGAAEHELPVWVIDPDTLRLRYPECGNAGAADSPRFRVVRVIVDDLVQTCGFLESQAVPHRLAAGSVIVPPEAAHGACLEFLPAQRAA